MNTNIPQKHTKTKIKNFTIPSFPYQEYGIKGFGKNKIPIMSMDQYIDHSKDQILHIECCKGLALAKNYKMGMVYGSLPPEEISKFNGNNSWSEIIQEIEKHDPTGEHRLALEEVADCSPGEEIMSMYKYTYFALGAVIPWFFALYLKKSNFANKTENNNDFTEDAKLFPNLLQYLNTLPFKSIGRVLFFTTYPNCGVVTHRDSIVDEHKDHNINLFFNGGWRPSFIWDEKNKQKIYLEKNSKSYFFNNRDYHGVDPEPLFRYTLRIDGTFTDELSYELGLEDGFTWKWDYEKL